MKLSDRAARAVVLPAGKTDHVFWDDTMSGFGVRVRGEDPAHCSRGWLAQYRVGSVQRRERLGDVFKVNLEDARKAARKLFAKAELGIDPAAERAKARIGATTLAMIADRYLVSKKDELRPTSYAAATRYLKGHWHPLRNRPLDSIKRADIAARLQDLKMAHGPAAAARARTHLSAVFTWAMGEGLADVNPVIGTNDPNRGARARERALTDAEIKAVWQACVPDDDFSRIVQLLLLTGCRRDEIGALEWSDEIDFDTGMLAIPGRRTKNGKQLTQKLSEPALDILRSVPRRDGRIYVFGKVGKGFTGMSHGLHRFQARMATAGNSLSHWSLHDLRRTMRSGLGRLGVAPHIAELAIGHTKAGIVAVYDRYRYEPEIADALAQWAEHVMAVVEDRRRKPPERKRARLASVIN
jgi:integrase